MATITAALLLSGASAGSWAQDKANFMRMPKALACGQPEWDKEAVRYELEGGTAVAFDLDDEGSPVNPRVARSSGWRLLDRMSERAVGKCRYAPPSGPDAMRTGLVINFKWTLAPRRDNPVPAALVPGSCPVSDRYAGFQPLSGRAEGGEGLLVRFLLDSTGKVFGFRAESAGSPEIYQAAEAYIASCRFTPAYWKSAPGPGNLRGRLIPNEA